MSDLAIAAAAGISPEILAAHVGDAEDAAALAYRSLTDRLLDQAAHTFRSAPSWEAGLFLFVRRKVRLLQDQRGATALHLGDPAGPASDCLRTIRDAYQDELLVLAGTCCEGGPGTVGTELLLGMVRAVLVAHVRDHGELRLDDLEASLAPMLFRYVPGSPTVHE